MLATVARSYREQMATFAGDAELDVWYSTPATPSAHSREFAAPSSSRKVAKRAEATLAKARTKDSMKAFAKLTRLVDGQPRIVDRTAAHRPDRAARPGRVDES